MQGLESQVSQLMWCALVKESILFDEQATRASTVPPKWSSGEKVVNLGGCIYTVIASVLLI